MTLNNLLTIENKNVIVDFLNTQYQNLEINFEDADEIWYLFLTTSYRFGTFILRYDEPACLRIIATKLFNVSLNLQNRIRALKLQNSEQWKSYENWKITQLSNGENSVGYSGNNATGTYQTNKNKNEMVDKNNITFINLFQNWFGDYLVEIEDIIYSILQTLY